MPILAAEPDLFPLDLLDSSASSSNPSESWWIAYTRSRQEKKFMRALHAKGVGFFGPTLEHRQRSPQGRTRTSFVPLFPNYVFFQGDEQARLAALQTNTLSRVLPVTEPEALLTELRQVRWLLTSGVAVTPEARLEPGQRVRIIRGSLVGLEGILLKRHNGHRLLIAVNLIQQGATIEIDDLDIEPVE